MDDIAQAVLAALGRRQNVLANTVCMERLRVTLRNPHLVDYDALNAVPSVLGTVVRGDNGLEVVFGPRMIDGVYHAFLRLTGLEAGTDALFPMSRQESNLKVHINAPTSSVRTRTTAWGSSHLDDDDVDTLKGLFADDETSGVQQIAHVDVELDTQTRTTANTLFDEQSNSEIDEDLDVSLEDARLLVLNGPNVNMLGIHDEQGKDAMDFSSILELCKQTASEAGFAQCVCLQSNHEGDLVDWIQDAWRSFDAIVINPMSYAPTSHTIRIAIEEAGIPCAQVCLDAADATNSLLNESCAINVLDEGIKGYARAIRELAEII